MRIEGSVAVVTGANRGLGRAFVEQLLARGAKRIYAGARDPSKLRDVVSSSGGRVVALRIDLGDPASIAAAAKTAKDATLLINNAGALEFGSQISADLAGIRRDFETNYFGTLQVTRAFVPALEANKNGAIVNVLAVVSLVSIPGLGGYSASKAAAHSPARDRASGPVRRVRQRSRGGKEALRRHPFGDRADRLREHHRDIGVPRQ